MSSDRQPTRPPSAQRRPVTPATYPIAPLAKQRWTKPETPRPAQQVRRRPLTNYIAFTKDALGRWTFAHHLGKEAKPMGMTYYTTADGAYREALTMAHLQGSHILLTSDFLAELHAEWEQAQREAQATPRAWELP